MKKVVLCSIFILIIPFLLSCNEPKDVYFFIDKAWEYHSSIKQARFEIEKYKNLRLEAISVYSPKVNGMTWLAPMFTIKKGNDPWETNVDYNQWGPYYSLDLQFQQPVFAFTRVISGIKAAQEGMKLANADVEITKWQVAKEIRLYYYGLAFGHIMKKTLSMADDILNNAITQAEESIQQGKTGVTDINLAQLKYFATQIPINRSFIEKSMAQAKGALQISTGEEITVDDFPERFVQETFELKDLDYYTKIMFNKRPLYKKLNFGINATQHLMELEYKAMIPVLFVGGFVKYNVAPTVDMHQNKFMSSSYNTFNGENRGIDGGFAVGFLWQFDPLKAVARGLQKKAELDQLHELKNYALKGFPVQLDKVIKDLEDLDVKVKESRKAIKHSQSWMFLAFNAYQLGEGEAKDIMEGLASFVKAKTDYYQAIYDYNQLIGELCEIVGIDVTKL